jgi:hypothetical protein
MVQVEPSTAGFRNLLASFCSAHQIAMDSQSLGIEFEADGYRVLISPDPRDSGRMLVDVVVTALDDYPGDLLMALHQLNHRSRIEHDWVATIDVSDRLCLHTQLGVTQMRVEDVDSILAEGIDRAAALDELCEGFNEPSVESGDGQADQDGQPGFLIRA